MSEIDDYSFGEYLEDHNYIIPQERRYEIIATINEGSRRKSTKVVLMRSKLPGHRDLYCIGIWDKKMDTPKGKTVLNYFDLQRLYIALGDLLRKEEP
ncbi:MAG: hypothetical protein IJJ44_00040 [Solobacterium sp.]|nr:hypothetical protein [Solobacterium sp.]